MVFAWSPADRTASFQLGKHCVTKYSEIFASATNSERVGARPSPLAMGRMESKICCLSDIGSLLWSAVPVASDVTQRRNWKSRSTIIGFMGELLANPGP